MSFDTFTALTILALLAAWTPGPNNAMVAASGASFGFRRTLPHVLGITIGFPFMIFVVGLFLGQLFEASTLLRETLRWGGAALLLWIAWKIATAGAIGRADGAPRPMRFHEAAAFQWINPKGWAMAIAITAQFITGAAALQNAATVAVVFLIAGLSSASGWAGFGIAMTRWLTTADRLRWFNYTMGGLIAACVVLMFV